MPPLMVIKAGAVAIEISKCYSRALLKAQHTNMSFLMVSDSMKVSCHLQKGIIISTLDHISLRELTRRVPHRHNVIFSHAVIVQDSLNLLAIVPTCHGGYARNADCVRVRSTSSTSLKKGNSWQSGEGGSKTCGILFDMFGRR